jgi:hypothetical protein
MQQERDLFQVRKLGVLAVGAKGYSFHHLSARANSTPDAEARARKALSLLSTSPSFPTCLRQDTTLLSPLDLVQKYMGMIREAVFSPIIFYDIASLKRIGYSASDVTVTLTRFASSFVVTVYQASLILYHHVFLVIQFHRATVDGFDSIFRTAPALRVCILHRHTSTLDLEDRRTQTRGPLKCAESFLVP